MQLDKALVMRSTAQERGRGVVKVAQRMSYVSPIPTGLRGSVVQNLPGSPLMLRIIPVLAWIAGGLATGACDVDSGVSAPSEGLLPVIPGLSGFGVETPAGRGGTIIRVTTLADRGEGSLRAALATLGRRVIVFEVAGTIELREDLEIAEPFVTVAGQTAPSPGVTLRGAGLRITTHDVLVQHVRIRVGNDSAGPRLENRDGLQILGSRAFNVVIDHVSVSWAVDEGVSTWFPVRDVTIANSIVAEGLMRAGHPDGEHSTGILVGDHAIRVAVIGNLFAHNNRRNPMAKGQTASFIANNLIYDPGAVAIHLGNADRSGPHRATIVGNVFVPGPSTRTTALVTLQPNVHRETEVYLNGNVAPALVAGAGSLPFEPLTEQAPLWPEGFAAWPAADVEQWVLAHAGARPADRDTVDQRLVAQVADRTGRIIDRPEEVGGWPALTPEQQPLEVPPLPHGDDDGDGYTNLEEWLHDLAARVEGDR